MKTVNKSVIKSSSLFVSLVAGSGYLSLQSHQHFYLFIADERKSLILITLAAVLNLSAAPQIDSSEVLSY